MSRVPQLDPAAIRAYVTRDWGRIRNRKRAHWQAHGSKTGLPGLLRAAEDLRNWMTARFPHWPTLEDREEDLETHRRVSQALASTSTIARLESGAALPSLKTLYRLADALGLSVDVSLRSPRSKASKAA